MLGSRFNLFTLFALAAPIFNLAIPFQPAASDSESNSIIASRAPTLPAVDFSVVKEGAAYPRANFMSNGDIMGSYTDFPPNGKQVLTIVTSTDNGASWQLTGTAYSKPVSNGTLDNAYPLQLPTGRILLAYRNHEIDSEGTPKLYRISISSSDDKGATWQFLGNAVEVTAKPSNNGVWEPVLRNTRSGELQLFFSREKSASNQDTVLLTSKDGGKKWGAERVISGGDQDTARDGMVGIVEMGGSSLIAVFESNENSGLFSLFTVSSPDGGATWGTRKSIYVPPPGKNAGAPQIARVGNTLVVSFMTNEDHPINPKESWIISADAKLLTSTDGGVTWTKSTVFTQPAFWPSVLSLKDQKSFLYLAGTTDGLKSQTIVLP